jgi:hypothetical protein
MEGRTHVGTIPLVIIGSDEKVREKRSVLVINEIRG